MKRRGMTLVEVLASVGMLTVFIALTGPPFVRMCRQLKGANETVHEAAVISDMVRTLREDVDNARSVEIAGDSAILAGALMIELADRTIYYQGRGDRWIRGHYEGRRPVHPDERELDSWPIPNARIGLELWRDGQRAYAVAVATAVIRTDESGPRACLANAHVLQVGGVEGGER